MTATDSDSRARARDPRGRWVAAQTGLGVLAAGAGAAGPAGYGLAGAGATLALGALARRRRTWAVGHPLDRLRHRRPSVAALPGARRRAASLGVVHTLLPALDVTGFADRNLPGGQGLGVLSDGHGHATVAAFPGNALPALPVGIVARWLADDPARPAAAQLVVEQFGVPSWDVHSSYQPTVAYRQLPYGGRRVAVRSWLVVRYEPLAAPVAAARRGGGTSGAHAAVAAAAARLRARLAAAGAPAVALDASAARVLLRQVGDADGRGEQRAEVWAGKSATHRTLTASVTSQDEWFRLLRGASSGRAERVVTAATLTLTGSRLHVRAAVRLVGTAASQVAGPPWLVLGGSVPARPAADQSAGLLATLPLAWPAGDHTPAPGPAARSVPYAPDVSEAP
ncbi:type VII secretion protein EccE [Streptomyces sp. MAR4 CNY-716]